jgi:hypothetical protein
MQTRGEVHMNNKISGGVSLVLLAAFLMSASVAVLAASSKQMRACHDALINKQKFHDLPMAAFSVYPGNKENRVHFTVRWDGLKADGHCQVSRQGNVKNVAVVRFHNNRKKHGSDYDKSEAGHGFYYDRHIGMWRDPDGEVCHTCTPENGFATPAKYRN